MARRFFGIVLVLAGMLLWDLVVSEKHSLIVPLKLFLGVNPFTVLVGFVVLGAGFLLVIKGAALILGKKYQT